MDVIQVAEELGVDPKKVRRYINQGRLAATKQKINSKEFKYIINDSDLGRFILIEESYKKLSSSIKEIYTLLICGSKKEQIKNEFNLVNRTGTYDSVTKIEISNAVEKYKRFRSTRLDYCGIKDHSKVFTPGEACARLAIRDLHVIYHLIKQKELEKVPVKKDLSPFGKNVFVSVDSMIHFLGTDKKTRFYTSKDVSELTNKTVNQIDRIALYYEIGRKIKKNNKSSIYLFSYGDLTRINKLKPVNGWAMNKKRNGNNHNNH